MLFSTYYQSTVFEPRCHQTWNGLGQVTNDCLYRITQMMHTDYVWHTPALVLSRCVGGPQVIERRNSASGRPSTQSYIYEKENTNNKNNLLLISSSIIMHNKFFINLILFRQRTTRQKMFYTNILISLRLLDGTSSTPFGNVIIKIDLTFTTYNMYQSIQVFVFIYNISI